MKVLNQLKEKGGFTLIELLISVCVMAIAFAGLATMQVACINGNKIASNLTTGITLAQDKMEELNSLDYDDPALSDNNPANNTDLKNSIDESEDDDHRELHIDAEGHVDQTVYTPPSQPPDGYIYTRIWNIADDVPMDGRKTVVVIVTWRGHVVSVSSIIGAHYS